MKKRTVFGVLGSLAIIAIVASVITVMGIRLSNTSDALTQSRTQIAGFTTNLNESEAKVTQLTTERDDAMTKVARLQNELQQAPSTQDIAFYRGLVLAALSTQGRVIPPSGETTYFDHPVYDSVRGALLAGHPNYQVDMIVVEGDALMRIYLAENYALHMIYPQAEGFWEKVWLTSPEDPLSFDQDPTSSR